MSRKNRVLRGANKLPLLFQSDRYRPTGATAGYAEITDEDVDDVFIDAKTFLGQRYPGFGHVARLESKTDILADRYQVG